MMIEDKQEIQRKKSSLSKSRILFLILVVIAFVVLIIGIVLIALSFKKKDCAQNDDGEEKQQAQVSGEQTLSSFCEYSEEEKRIGLHDILVRAKKSYYEYNPFLLTSDPDATRDEIKEKYTAYNPGLGLHYKGMKRDEAIKMFQDYLWDNTDLSDKEVRVG